MAKSIPRIIKEFVGNFFSNWAFSNAGIAFFASASGLMMGGLAYLTTEFQAYAPFSYGLAIAFGLILGLIICSQFNRVWAARFTTKPTFAEFKMEKGRINLVKKSNIYGEPSVDLGIVAVQEQPAIQANSARNQKRLNERNPPTFKEHDLKTASIRVIFDKPVANSNFHVHLVSVGGQCPTRIASAIDNRTANVALENITNDCAFQVWFNERKTPDS